jgi:uncharacterized membrane protein
MLTWGIVIALALGVYAQRAAGAVLVDTERVDPKVRQVLDALPLAIITAVVTLAAFSTDGQIRFDARVGGVAVAALCAWRRLPMFITVVAAAGATAILRLIA